MCLQTLIDKTIEISKPASKLEVENNKTALADLKRGLRELRKDVIKMEDRIKDEVGPEVIKYWNKQPKGKPRGKSIQDNLNN